MARIVWFHPRQVFPPRGGGEFRSIGLVEGALAAGHEVLLVHPDDGPASLDPLPDGVAVTTVRLRTGLSRAVAKVASRDPLRAPRATRASMAAARTAIAAFEPDLAVASQVMCWPLARRLLPEVPWVYDAHNVERDLFDSHLATARGVLDRLTFGVDARRVARAERELVQRSSVTVAVSPTDADGLAAIVGTTRSPVVVPSSMKPPARLARPSEAPPTALFVGTLDFPPNVEAIGDLVRDVMPRVVAALPGARLLVAGRRPSADTRALLRSQPWIEFVEDAPDIDELYLRARCAALPFRSGSGTKLKLYEALTFSLPVVATPTTITGVDLVPGLDVLVGDDPAAVAACLVGVLRDGERADTLGAAGRRAFDERLSWERAAFPALRGVLAELG